MSKGLMALEKIKQTIALKNDGYINLFETLDFLTIEKELKALEIIKNNDIISTLDFIQRIAQNKEEYNFLIEVLL